MNVGYRQPYNANKAPLQLHNELNPQNETKERRLKAKTSMIRKEMLNRLDQENDLGKLLKRIKDPCM